MCPNGAQLSAYMDGELDAVRTEEIRLHVAGCATCARTLGSFQILQKSLAPADETELRIHSERVWNAVGGAVLQKQVTAKPGKRFGMVSVATAAVLAFVAGSWFSGFFPAQSTTQVATATVLPSFNLDEQSIEALLSELENGSSGSEVFIELPDQSPLTIHGEPTLLRAKDMRRVRP